MHAWKGSEFSIVNEIGMSLCIVVQYDDWCVTGYSIWHDPFIVHMIVQVTLITGSVSSSATSESKCVV